MNKNIILIIGLLLIGIGLLKPNISNIFTNKTVVIDVLELPAPTDEKIRKEANDIVDIFKNSGAASKPEAKRLRDLYLDLAKLVALDEENEVITKTEEIRQANSLAGVMLRLDIKDKYSNLAKEAKEVVVAFIGDDDITLSKDLRIKAVDALNTLAWACNEGSK
jgi:hypothetical protein